jgi:hypothetical protein
MPSDDAILARRPDAAKRFRSIAKLQILAVRNLLKRESPSERRRAPSPAPRGRGSSPVGREVAPRGSGPARAWAAPVHQRCSARIRRCTDRNSGPGNPLRSGGTGGGRLEGPRDGASAPSARERASRDIIADVLRHHRVNRASSSGQSRIMTGTIRHRRRPESNRRGTWIGPRGAAAAKAARAARSGAFFRGRHAPRVARRGFRALPCPATLPIAVASG